MNNMTGTSDWFVKKLADDIEKLKAKFPPIVVEMKMSVMDKAILAAALMQHEPFGQAVVESGLPDALLGIRVVTDWLIPFGVVRMVYNDGKTEDVTIKYKVPSDAR